ncbi:MAG: hypothetical protein NWF06_01975, partial [Candidatus Bathyarchaeota archaeon]|nr:hypothetical protein [Candidatus Bathyarchaeum sp.]
MTAFSTALSHFICATEPINSSENGADQNMSIQHATVDDHTANVHTDMVSTNTQIMSFSDATRLVSVTPQIDVIPPLSADPYVKETLVDFLSRVYSHQVVWQTSYPHGYLLADMRFPDFLFSRQQIWNKLQNFKFFRAGVKIGIRINGTRFNYGSLLAMWEPMSYNTGSLVFATHNVYAASGYPCFTMNPTENEVFEFIMPYALPYPYIDIERFTDGVSYNWWEQGSLSIYVLNPLNPSGPVDVTIYASFVDVDVAGYTSLTNMALPPFFFADQTTFPALLPQPFAFAALEKKDDKLEAQGKSSVNRSSEAQKKSERGVIGGVFETVSRVAGALTVVPEIGVVASAASMVAKGISVVADLFGWSKPPSLLATTPAAIQWSNISNTHGLSDCRVLSVDPANCVHAPSSIAGGRDDE